MTSPDEFDSRHLLHRLYSDDLIMNAGRSLDYDFIIRAVIRNYGYKMNGTPKDVAGRKPNSDPVQFVRFPTADGLYEIVWEVIPDFLKPKIITWAKKQDQRAIAEAIVEFVKTALGLLPVPIPPIFLNGVANLMIPPLVLVIMSKISDSESKADGKGELRMVYETTPDNYSLLQDLDCKVLLAAGVTQLPAHLAAIAKANAKAQVAGDIASDDGTSTTDIIKDIGLPDNGEAEVALQQFYNNDATNACKPLHLAQMIAAQCRTNPCCDQDPNSFGYVVWSKAKDDKSLATNIRTWSGESPPNRDKISDAIYPTVRDILQKKPYYVPDSILESFTAMKVPEVVEYIVNVLG